jgi:hypothetical protein
MKCFRDRCKKVPTACASGQEEGRMLFRRVIYFIHFSCGECKVLSEVPPRASPPRWLLESRLLDAGDLKLAALAASSSLPYQQLKPPNTLNLITHYNTLINPTNPTSNPNNPNKLAQNVRRPPSKRTHNQSRPHHRLKRHQPTAATAKARRTTRGGR